MDTSFDVVNRRTRLAGRAHGSCTQRAAGGDREINRLGAEPGQFEQGPPCTI
jgi:hypothetical protein